MVSREAPHAEKSINGFNGGILCDFYALPILNFVASFFFVKI